MVKTPPFHGGIRGSSPLGTTTKNEHCIRSVFLWCMPCIPNPCGFSVLSHPDRSKLLPAFAKNSPLDSFLYASPLGTTTKNEHCFCSVFLWCMPCIPNPCGFSVLSHPDRSKLLPAFAKNSPLDSFLYASPLGTTKVFSLEHLVNSVYLKTFGLSFERFITTSKCSFFTIILFTKAFIKMNFLLLMIIQPM